MIASMLSGKNKDFVDALEACASVPFNSVEHRVFENAEALHFDWIDENPNTENDCEAREFIIDLRGDGDAFGKHEHEDERGFINIEKADPQEASQFFISQFMKSKFAAPAAEAEVAEKA